MLVFMDCSLCNVEGLDRGWNCSCVVLAFPQQVKMAREKLRTFQRTGQCGENAELVMFSVNRSLIKGFYNAEVIFWVTMVKMQRLLIRLLELFI